MSLRGLTGMIRLVQIPVVVVFAFLYERLAIVRSKSIIPI